MASARALHRDVQPIVAPASKRPRICVRSALESVSALDELLGAAARPREPGAGSSENQSPESVVAAEIAHLQSIDECVCCPNTVLAWYNQPIQLTNLPCLSQVASALYALKPSSGGLECDLGSMNDVLCPKRASLGAGYVEVEMMLRLNRHLIPSDPLRVKQLDSDWRDYIPANRPAVSLNQTHGVPEESESSGSENDDDFAELSRSHPVF